MILALGFLGLYLIDASFLTYLAFFVIWFIVYGDYLR